MALRKKNEMVTQLESHRNSKKDPPVSGDPDLV